MPEWKQSGLTEEPLKETQLRQIEGLDKELHLEGDNKLKLKTEELRDSLAA